MFHFSCLKTLFTGFAVLQCCFVIANGISSEESGNNGREGGTLSTIQTIAISFGAVSGFVMCSVCTWSWWRRLCYSRQGTVDVERAEYHEDMGYSFTRTGSLETLEIRNLSINRADNRRVRFEPLPDVGELHLDPRANIEMQTITVPGISTISGGGESDIHAQDWFEDSTRTNFPRVNVEYVQEIGRGWFGKVLEAQVKEISPFFQTVKAIVQEQRDDSENREQMKFLHNARIYRDMSHENILKLLGYCIERGPYMLIYEHWPLGDLKFYLITHAERGETLYKQGTLIRMAIDIAKGLEYMSQSGYVHGDLSARNCLVANTAGKVVIGDYGLAPQMYKDDYHWDGLKAWPIRWAAPESLHCTIGAIQATQTTAMCNVWTYGIVLWEIFEFGKSPYPELTNEDVLDQVFITQTYVLEPPRTPYLTMKTKDTLYNIMLSCWNIDPETRPTISNILDTLAQP